MRSFARPNTRIAAMTAPILKIKFNININIKINTNGFNNTKIRPSAGAWGGDGSGCRLRGPLSKKGRKFLLLSNTNGFVALLRGPKEGPSGRQQGREGEQQIARVRACAQVRVRV